jgi:ABC-type polar amino acid transport system ATPase subunit
MENSSEKKREAANVKIGLQNRNTMAIEDVQENIAKNYKGYKLFEAYKYDEIYTAKVAKGGISETMAFDKAGNFLQKVTLPAPVTAKPAEQSHPTDTMHHAKNAPTTEPVKK